MVSNWKKRKEKLHAPKLAWPPVPAYPVPAVGLGLGQAEFMVSMAYELAWLLWFGAAAVFRWLNYSHPPCSNQERLSPSKGGRRGEKAVNTYKVSFLQ